MFLYARAATKVLAAGGAVNNGSAIVEAMLSTSFKGIGEQTVELDSNGDAIEPYSLMNYLEFGTGEMQGVAVATYVSKKLNLQLDLLRWPGNTTHAPLDRSEERVHLAVLWPTSGAWAGGLRIAGAAALAIESVNSAKDLLPRHVLEYSWANSGCSAKQGLVAMGEVLGLGHRIDAVIGPGCSAACTVTGRI